VNERIADGLEDTGELREIQSRVIPAPRSIPARIKPMTPRMIQVSDLENTGRPATDGSSFEEVSDASGCANGDDTDLSETSGCTSKH
jgi:hypothetical protein